MELLLILGGWCVGSLVFAALWIAVFKWAERRDRRRREEFHPLGQRRL